MRSSGVEGGDLYAFEWRLRGRTHIHWLFMGFITCICHQSISTERPVDIGCQTGKIRYLGSDWESAWSIKTNRICLKKKNARVDVMETLSSQHVPSQLLFAHFGA
jgi:hypothetical protein